MSVDVSTPVFEGPFDLLLHLILREEVDLYEVTLRSIVDGYLTELDRMERLDLDIATEFLLIAATLVELKTRRMLPGDGDLDLDEELALWEERDVLLARLLEAKTFKDVARRLEAMAIEAARSVPRQAGLEDWCLELTPDLLEGVAAADLRDAFIRAATPRPIARVAVEHIAPIRASVADAVAELLDELPRAGGRISFRRLTFGLVDRLEIIVRFLAVLELYKQGAVDLEQVGTFGEIVITWSGLDAEAMALATVDSYDG